MASGLVAKKIALFELKPQSLEQQCRLKRKHAIRRKKYRGKERRIVTREGTSMIALSTSDEHLNLLLKDSDEDTCSSSLHYHQSCSSHLSASCSALFDLVSVESSSESGGTVDDTAHMEIIPRSKRYILKSSGTTKDNKISKRLNIIDIDIEIKIEQKEQRNGSPVTIDVIPCGGDEYEQFFADSEGKKGSIKSGTTAALPPVAVTTDRIRLTASVDDSTHITKDHSANYHCTKCSHDDALITANDKNNELLKDGSSNDKDYFKRTNKAASCSDNDNKGIKNSNNFSPEPLYENIFSFVPPPPVSLGAPPLPPKRLFGDSFTTNYSCLPVAGLSEFKRKTENTDNKTISPTSCAKNSANKDKKAIKSAPSNVPFFTETEKTKLTNITSAGINCTEKVTMKTTTTTSDDVDCKYPKTNKTEHVTGYSGNSLSSTIKAVETIPASSPNESTTKAATDSPSVFPHQIDCSKEFSGISTEDHDNDAFVDGEDDEEPYYEDLYDYCNGSEIGNGTGSMNPILELFREQLNSLEQNAEDDVEYCDCSTIMALMKNTTTPTTTSSNCNNKLHNNDQDQHFDTSSLISYEIYDDCFGVETMVSNQKSAAEYEDKNVNRSNHCDTSNEDGIDCVTKSDNMRKTSTTTTSRTAGSPTTSHSLTDFFKAKVTKASTPRCWRKVTSSSDLADCGGSSGGDHAIVAKAPYSSSPSLTTESHQQSSSNHLSMLPSLSSSKTKLAESKEIRKTNADREQPYAYDHESAPEESVQKEASQVITENERNVSRTKNVNSRTTTNNAGLYSYGIFNHSNNGFYTGSKPRFGGRPVIAHHPLDANNAEDDQGKNNESDNNVANIYQNSKEHHERRKRNKKDDNEIFNKPLPLPPANASANESLYEEPIYGITNQLTATYSDSGKTATSPTGASPGKRRSSAPAAPPPFLPNKLVNGVLISKPGSIYSHSPSVSSGSTYGYSSGSINEYGESNSASKYGPSSCQTVASSGSTSTGATKSSGIASNGPTPDGMSIYGINDKLPPTPPSKFSSIAKTAGRKIAKKFLGIRKNSKGVLEEPLALFNSPHNVGDSSDSGTSHSPTVYAQGSKGPNPSVTNYDSTNQNSGKVNGGSQTNHYGGSVCSSTQIRRPISRPSIPPPEPPKYECSTGSGVPAVPDKDSNYNIYDSKRNDDDYDDSDFYDSDSELIRNFVSQVQPIYSMEEEPLYQYYTYGISLKPDDDYQPVIPKNLGLTLDMLVPRVGQRTLWCELPGVVSSGILSILSDKQKQLQEAIFEVLTSEVSYLKSLDVLILLFYKNEELLGVLTEEERGYLFGNIEDVRDCSQAFLSELLGKWEESWYIQEIGEIISRATETKFSVYKEYCRNKPYQDKTMQRLRHTRDEFVTVVKAIEEDERCQMLQVDSFLMLPMQRITRLPLLVNAVIQRTAPSKEKCKCEEALKCLTNLVLSCNDAARESQDAEETMAILEKLEFTRGIKALPDLGAFIMKGDFMKNPFDQGRGNQINWTFRKAKRTFYWLLLFSKQLLVARRKANGRFEIIDMIDPLESNIKALPNLEGVSKDFKHFFMLHFNRKETVYFLAARTNSEVERWKSKLDAIKPKEELRVEAIFPYDARRPDEMTFNVGDVIRVSQIQPDGWYFGTKLATGESGWFPGNYCCENAS